MKRFILFSLLSVFLVCGCAGQRRQSANAGTTEETPSRKKPSFGEILIGLIFDTLERERDDRRKIPNTNTPDPYLPPE